MRCKVYVQVDGRFTPEGQIIPRVIYWPDGRQFAIDEVFDIRPAASLKAGGAGIRYRIRIGSRETYLFLEETRWFVEARTF